MAADAIAAANVLRGGPGRISGNITMIAGTQVRGGSIPFWA